MRNMASRSHRARDQRPGYHFCGRRLKRCAVDDMMLDDSDKNEGEGEDEASSKD